MIHFVVHDEGDSVGVVVVEGVKSGQKLTGWIMDQDRDLEVLLGFEMGEEAALRHAHMLGELADGQAFQPHLGRQRQRGAEDGGTRVLALGHRFTIERSFAVSRLPGETGPWARAFRRRAPVSAQESLSTTPERIALDEAASGGLTPRSSNEAFGRVAQR